MGAIAGGDRVLRRWVAAALVFSCAAAGRGEKSALSVAQKNFCGYIGDGEGSPRGSPPEGPAWSRRAVNECAALLFGAAGCDLNSPDAACARKILVPIREAKLPFDPETVLRAYTPEGPYLARRWRLTTLHQIRHGLLAGRGNCALAAFRYGGEPFDVPGCGRFLFAGGHPMIKNCPAAGSPFACISAVPYDERPDIGLIEAAAHPATLPAAAVGRSNQGEIVYIVHEPPLCRLSWGSGARARKDPCVTRGVLLEIRGTIAAAIAPTFDGSSGGTALNSRGEVIGIASHKTDGAPYAFIQTLNPRMIELIRRASLKE